MTPPGKNLYIILEVDDTANEVELKASYRRLARQLHPDATGGDRSKAEQFKEVCAAYAILGNSTQRKAYDTERLSLRGEGYGLFGALFDELVGRIKTEGIRTHNVDSLVKDFVKVAEDAKTRIPEKARKAQESPSGLLDFLEEIFESDIDLTRGPERGPEFKGPKYK